MLTTEKIVVKSRHILFVLNLPKIFSPLSGPLWKIRPKRLNEFMSNYILNSRLIRATVYSILRVDLRCYTITP